jgi:hypothetical protein
MAATSDFTLRGFHICKQQIVSSRNPVCGVCHRSSSASSNGSVRVA